MPIFEFDRYEDMMEALWRDREAADSKVQPWQEKIKGGQYFVRRVDGIPIYGEVLKERKRPKHLKNYRFVECYSVILPEGEKGDIHVSTIEKILTRQEFDDARGRGWR
jgi:hypothetical protein